MSKEKNINKLLKSLKDNSITKEEYDFLMNIIRDSKNESAIEKAMDYVLVREEAILTPINQNQDDEQMVFDRINEKLDKIGRDELIEGKGNIFLKHSSFFKIAATVTLLLGLFYFYQNNFFGSQEVRSLIDRSESNTITLQLGNGEIKVISEEGNSIVVEENGDVISQQNGNQLIYNKGVPNIDKLVYNTLKVPYGRTFKLLLSDGTKVMLNSGTSLKYPIKFLNEKNRRVFLTGEAFFEVMKDSEHPFIVNAENIDIKVYGTKFNVSSYPEDGQSDVVLIEGSVSMSAKDDDNDNEGNIMLEPGFMGTYDKENKDISLEQVNTNLYTSWMKGDMVFRHMTFDNILKKLERKYDVSIINENKEMADDEFNASFPDVPIEKILEGLKGIYPIDFSREDNLIIIKQSN